ncbi:PHD/FYVE-zinc-finger like domain-containing protein [Podospora didyma]|uniref:PHD/FYVE-zinc-finger like domain-containing protein n=1 Tax=Podospora didyma TaxID=330526 RepID=A0AAE0K5X5_9PEZI|nr:PHD/FYVE-zinc-finger like domain-containing protein [Podospora didyma]
MAKDASSDDELVDGMALEPAAYEFQSDLSDNEDSAPLAASPPHRVINGVANGPDDMVSYASEPGTQIYEEAHSPKRLRSSTATSTRASSVTNHAKIVHIDVTLPWVPPKKRANFVYIDVADDIDELAGGDNHHKSRRRKHMDSFGNYHMDDSFFEGDLKKRKRRGDDSDYSGQDDDSEPRSFRRKQKVDYYFESSGGKRSTRTSTRATSMSLLSDEEADLPRKGRALRPRAEKHVSYARPTLPDDDKDELQDNDNSNDGDFTIVQSDLVTSKKTKKRLRLSSRIKPKKSSAGRRHSDNFGSDIEFETRRSSRANKNTKSMVDYADDDEFEYYEEKAPGAPKISSMREVFQPPKSVEFKESHRPICDTCGYGEISNKGPLVYCQGCSNSYHKNCLGTRSTREQTVTKVGNDSFVMQCRFCTCNYKKKDKRLPSHDTCQGCTKQNPACVPFSQKKTPKQEEKLRLENDGVDPIIPVNPEYIENSDNVLFRCGKCHRGWHYEHLPHPTKLRDPAIDDPLNLRKHRRDEYQIEWLCKLCIDTDEEKVDKLVAWRPVDRSRYRRGQTILEFNEDDVEYLVKWMQKSYNHCIWVPGQWVFGVVSAISRQAFLKRTFGESADADEMLDDRAMDSLMRWTEKEAIHESWITPDIILDVQCVPRPKDLEQKYKYLSRDAKMEDDKGRIFHITKILVKFEGLGYDDVVWDTPPPSDSGALWNAYLDAYHEYLNGKHFQSEQWKNMQTRIDHFRTLNFTSEIEVKEQPKGLTRGKLMKYQVDGLNWMLFNFRNERSVILADEMGLGKTVQVVALLSSLVQDKPKIWPFLIVVPNSTCPNWRREIKKWAPDLRVVAYYGGKESQKLALQYELFPNGSRELKAHVVIMSYDSAKDTETPRQFHGIKWAGLVVDEAQALKNDENTLYKALLAMRIQFKLLLTGTPLQNNKRELFNLLQFVDPSRRAEKLDEEFAEITKTNLSELHEMIRPYFLRRTKAMVLKFLPPMAQIILPVSMTVLQERLCKSIMSRNPELIRSVFARGKLKANERGSLSNILMQLRKCLCHPFVYSQAVEDRNTGPELMRRNLVEASSKLLLLEVMLPKLKERGHRVLMFSQFLEELTILEDFLAGMELKFERLDGSQSSMEKQKRIDMFNAPDSKLFCMLLSTRAGGVGINLATADTVIILDPDWNPHQDIQALARAHRIGQKKKVLCFQLMTVDSAEEKILQMGRKKMALDHLLIETMDDKEGESTNDVESVLKHGAAALFGEGQKKDRIHYDSAAVDKLLDRSAEEETKVDGDKSAESAFALARVWAHDEGTLTEDMAADEQTLNPNVWDNILQQRAEEARKEQERITETLGRGGRRRNAANYTSQNFDFEEPLDGLDSDRGSGDDDFIGGEESAPESSDDDDEGKNLQDIKPQESTGHPNIEPQITDPRQLPSQSNQKVAREAASVPAVDPRKPTSQSYNVAQRPNIVPVNQAAPVPSTSGHALVPTPRRRGRPPGSLTRPKVPQSVHGAPQPQGKPPARVSVVPLPATAQQAAARVNVNTILKQAAPATNPTVVERPATHKAIPPQPATPFRAAPAALPLQLPVDPCIVCGYLHPVASWECPEMKQEVCLRIALDKLRMMTHLKPQEVVVKKVFLLEKLRLLKLGSN